MKIKNIFAIEVLDSRGNPTLETFVELENGTKGFAYVPSGASTGSHEALELRDKDPSRFHGKGVLKAVSNVNEKIAPALKGFDIEDLQKIDKKLLELDGTENKSNLGANAILSVSLACARALANYKSEPLWKVLNEYYFPEIKPSFPRPMVNVINGGAHANFRFDFQEYLIIPKKSSIAENVKVASEIFHQIGKELKKIGLSTLVGDEGGFSPELEDNEAPFRLILDSAKKLRYKNGKDFELGIDTAATEFLVVKRTSEVNKETSEVNTFLYELKKEGKIFSPDELIKFYSQLVEKYKIYSLEDPFAEDDWKSFAKFTNKFPERLIIGDDLYVTNPKRLERGIKKKATNAILVKVNQIGTLSETVETIKIARKAGFKVVISHRSGETEDPFIADLSVGAAADFIKTGSTCRSERTAKYNRLLEIYYLS